MVASYYAWDPEFDCITKETDAAGAVTARYTQEPKLDGGLISQHRGGASSFYHYDAIGTTRALTNSSQSTTDTAVYTAFGEKVASVGSTINPFGFFGKRRYQTVNTIVAILCENRFYVPALGRVLAPNEISAYLVNPFGESSLVTLTDKPPFDKPRINVFPLKHNFDTLKCGSKAIASWWFTINFGAPCDGYLVQRVNYFCFLGNCAPKYSNGCVAPSSELQEKAHYYEYWEFKKGSIFANSGAVIDSAEAPIEMDNCEFHGQMTELRYFCKADLKDKKLEWPTVGFYNVDVCRKSLTANGLPSVGEFDEWSTAKQSAEPSFRQFWLHFDCCTNCSKPWICASGVPGHVQTKKASGPCPIQTEESDKTKLRLKS